MNRSLLVGMLCAASCFGQANPLTQAVQGRYQAMKMNLLDTAEMMSEENYAYKLTPPQRALGEWLEHTAMSSYGSCATIKGEPTPEIAKTLHGLKSKAAIQKALQDAFAYCDSAMQGLTDQKALAPVTVAGKEVVPVTGMIGLITMMNEHYGNLVGYIRSKGMVPPSTARMQKKKS
jgi:uncharacterized damage-inducible protein DinB